MKYLITCGVIAIAVLAAREGRGVSGEGQKGGMQVVPVKAKRPPEAQVCEMPPTPTPTPTPGGEP